MDAQDYLPRLAMIRYLYQAAAERSLKPLPLGAEAILTFHDAAEMFLRLAGEHLNADLGNRLEFARYFDAIDKELERRGAGPNRLAGKGRMLTLNQVRVGFKHYGTPPDAATLAASRRAIEDFLDENTPAIFDGIKLADVSLADLVRQDDAREALHGAEAALTRGDTRAAGEAISRAFDLLLRRAQRAAAAVAPYLSPFALGPRLFTMRLSGGRQHDPDVVRFADDTAKAIEALQHALRVVMVGIDMRKYHRFERAMPRPILLSAGEYMFIGPAEGHPTTEECRFGLNFTIEAALQMQEFDEGDVPPLA